MNRAVAHALPRRKPELIGLDLLVAATAATAAGALLTNHVLPIAVLVAGALLVVVLTQVPWMPYVMVAASVATVSFYAAWPEVLGIKIPELVLAASLFAIVARFGSNELPAPAVHTWLMLVFLVAVGGGVYLGVEHRTSLDAALKGMRPMVFYAAFWPALVVAANPRWRMVVLRLAAFAVPALVGLQFAQAQVGMEHRLFAITSAIEHVVLTPQADGFLRVRPPALTLTYVATIFAAAYLLWGPARYRLRAAVVCGAGVVGVLLSLNRNMIIGIGLGLTLSALILPRRNRVVVAALVCGLLAVASLSLWQAPRHAAATAPVIERVLSIGDVTELQEGTLSDRSYENRFALSVLRREPLTGIGWGTPYGARLIEYRDGRLVNEPRGFLHQQYLWIWMRTGLIGVLALLALLGLALTGAARWSRRRTWDDRSWLGPAVLASGTALAASANVGTYLTNPESIVVFVAVLAFGCVMQSEMGLPENEGVP